MTTNYSKSINYILFKAPLHLEKVSNFRDFHTTQGAAQPYIISIMQMPVAAAAQA